MALDASTRDTLVELRERHRNVLDGYDSTVGLVVRIRKNGTARNSPVELEVKDHRHAAERDISRLVATLGLEALFLADDRQQVERALANVIEQLDVDEFDAWEAPVADNVEEPRGRVFGKHLPDAKS